MKLEERNPIDVIWWEGGKQLWMEIKEHRWRMTQICKILAKLATG